MRIGIQTWGSYGDVRPFLAVAGGLAAAGHEVSLNITSIDNCDYTETAKDLGLRLQMIGSIDMVSRKDLIELGREIVAQRNPLRQLHTIMDEFFEPVAEEMYQAAILLCERNDLVIGHSLVYPVQAAALKTGVNFATVSLFHGFLPTDMRPPIGLPNLGRLSNRFLWGVLRTAVKYLMAGYINSFRIKKQLPIIKDCFDDVWISPQLNLLGVSHVFCEQQPDWDEHHKICGFFDSPQLQHEGDISTDLQQFIDAGAPPVFMGFGSMLPPIVEAQQETITLFIQAAKSAGCRAIIQASLWRECRIEPDEDIYFVTECPHAQIFPQCKAVVHHGGSGTTQATTKAGVPSIIVIHIADQQGWAYEARRIGIAPKPIRRHKLTSKLLSRRIRTVLESTDMQSKAKSVAEQVRNENGVAVVVASVEEVFGNDHNNQGLQQRAVLKKII